MNALSAFLPFYHCITDLKMVVRLILHEDGSSKARNKQDLSNTEVDRSALLTYGQYLNTWVYDQSYIVTSSHAVIFNIHANLGLYTSLFK